MTTKSSETVAAFTDFIDVLEFSSWEKFWLAALKGLLFLGIVGGLLLLGTGAAQSLLLLPFPVLS
jgi:hypothetical protein